MKKLLFASILCFAVQVVQAQYTLITPGNGQPSINASTTTNGVLIPRLNTTERNQMTNQQQGTTIFNTMTNAIEYWDGTVWRSVSNNYNSTGCDDYCPPRPIVNNTIGLDYYLGNTGTDVVNAIALADPNSPTSVYYVTGYAKQFLSNTSGYFLSNYNATPMPWERRAANATGYDVAVDANGDIYTTGHFFNNGAVITDFGSGPLTSQGGNDIFLAKYNASGTLLWIRTAGSSGNDLGRAISLDATGNVYLTGYIGGDVSTWGISGHAGGKDIFIAKYDTNGNFLNANRAGGGADDEGNDINVKGGLLVVAGYFNATATFGSNTYTSNGGKDLFLASFNSSCAFQNTLVAGSSSDDSANGLFCLSSNVFVTGYFSETFSMPKLPTSTLSVSSEGGKDMFWAKLFPDINDNNKLKALQMVRGGGDHDDEGTKISAIGLDPSSSLLNIMLVGNFSGRANFGGPFLVTNTNSGFLSSYNASGQYEWGKALSKSSSSSVMDIATPTSSLKPYVVGSFTPYGWNLHGSFQPIMKLWTMN